MLRDFDGIVSSITSMGDCVLVRCDEYYDSLPDVKELMHNSYKGCSFCVVDKLEEAGFFSALLRKKINADRICNCSLLKIHGIGLVGGDVLCRVLRTLFAWDISVLGVSSSESGIALALPLGAEGKALQALTLLLFSKELT